MKACVLQRQPLVAMSCGGCLLRTRWRE